MQSYCMLTGSRPSTQRSRTLTQLAAVEWRGRPRQQYRHHEGQDLIWTVAVLPIVRSGRVGSGRAACLRAICPICCTPSSGLLLRLRPISVNSTETRLFLFSPTNLRARAKNAYSGRAAPKIKSTQLRCRVDVAIMLLVQHCCRQCQICRIVTDTEELCCEC